MMQIIFYHTCTYLLQPMVKCKFTITETEVSSFSSMAATEIVIEMTFGTASEDNFVRMTIFQL